MTWRDTLKSALFGTPVTPGKMPSPTIMDQGFGELLAEIETIKADTADALALAAGVPPPEMAPVRVLTTSNISQSSGMENGDTIDGVVVSTGDRIAKAVAGGNTGNGIFVVSASGAAARATDADEDDELYLRKFTVSEGTHAGETWQFQSEDPVIGTTALVVAKVKDAEGYEAEVIAARGGEAELNDRLDALQGITDQFALEDDIDGIEHVDAIPGEYAGAARAFSWIESGGRVRFAKPLAAEDLGNYQTSEDDIDGYSFIEVDEDPLTPRALRAVGPNGFEDFLARVEAYRAAQPPDHYTITPVQRRSSPCGAFFDSTGRRFWELGDCMTSWWTYGDWQFRNSVFMTGVGSIPSASFAGSLRLFQMLDGSGAFEMIEVGKDIDSAGVDDHNRPAVLLDGRAGARFPLSLIWANHGSRPRDYWRANEMDGKFLGERETINTYVDHYTYVQPWRNPSDPNEIWVFGRAVTDDYAYTWGVNISTDNGLTWTDFYPLFNGGAHYANTCVMRDGTGVMCFLHVREASNTYKPLVMVKIGWDRSVSTFADGEYAADFTDGYTPLDPWTVEGDVIYTPSLSAPDRRLRMTDAREVSEGVFQVPFFEWTGNTSAVPTDCTVHVATVDCTGVSPAVTIVEICDGGVNISTFESGFETDNPSYIGGAAIVGENLVLVCRVNPAGDGASVASIFDFTDDEAITEEVLQTVQAPNIVARPNAAVRLAADGVTYEIGDYARWLYGRYSDFSTFSTRARAVPIAEWLP